MSVLRPRDIQARIRAGESPEQVAAVAQTTVDKIMGFATPVLAERAYVAQQAQRASVRRRAGDGPVGHLAEAVAARLEDQRVDPETVEWDAWRREDGRWTLVAEYAVAGDHRRARFAFDAAGRYVVAEDDEARRLVGERSPGAPDAGAAAGPPAEEQLGLGDDAVELVTGRRPEPPATPGHPAAPEQPGHPAVAVQEQPAAPAAVPAAVPAAAARGTGSDWIATQASERPEPEALFEASAVAPDEPAAPATPDPGAAEDPAAAAEPDPGAERPRRPRRTGRSKGRASVPSWDEIMFGSGRTDD